ncbi:SLC13 family permease [Leucobacter sp. M11]|uniref:SLC13 family permease n=1 Tax=Leucobacter sp. M11 TaxID=2993565 RepID=UPI002D7E7230|nr:SLC13 family permease [Leucobacter sp. M11]MEB4615038.1 SLC13 family permease [Leucobacter sp. M11]
MSAVRYATTPPANRRVAPGGPPRPARAPRSARRLVSGVLALLAGALLVAPALLRTLGGAADAHALSLPGAITLAIFLLAVWGWIFTPLDDTLIAFLAAAALIVFGALPADTFFAALGDDTIWLLICACIIAAGVASSGLALRAAAALVTRARTPRGLFHRLTAALILTAFAIPATSGRAALARPVYQAIAAALPGRASVLRGLGLLFPTVILLSAVGSLLGAGAHLITSQILASATGTGISFLQWAVLGLPLAVLSSHLAAELILLRFTRGAERRTQLRVDLSDIRAVAPGPVTGPLGAGERRALSILLAVIALWCSEPLHGLAPAVVALLGAIAITLPAVGVTSLGRAVTGVPWNLLLFLAATLALGKALTDTGAAAWLGESALGPVRLLGAGAGIVFLCLVIAISLAAHLVIQSRSARSAALIPVVIAIAPGLGIDPAAAAFASTAAAGFCLTLPSSAKPVAMFSDPELGAGAVDPADLLRLSAWLAPLLFVLIAACSLWLWPALGLPLVS